MNTFVYEGVELETCPGCLGEWVDMGELETIVSTVEQTFSPQEIRSVNNLDRNSFKMAERPGEEMLCPNCRDEKLERFQYASSTSVALDRCPFCKGIWLDHGEIEAVQVLAEGWREYMDQDRAQFGAILKKIAFESQAQLDKSAGVSKLRFINFFLTKAVRFLG
jgi:Zn-finger nucleic acid-binding protein